MGFMLIYYLFVDFAFKKYSIIYFPSWSSLYLLYWQSSFHQKDFQFIHIYNVYSMYVQIATVLWTWTSEVLNTETVRVISPRTGVCQDTTRWNFNTGKIESMIDNFDSVIEKQKDSNHFYCFWAHSSLYFSLYYTITNNDNIDKKALLLLDHIICDSSLAFIILKPSSL